MTSVAAEAGGKEAGVEVVAEVAVGAVEAAARAAVQAAAHGTVEEAAGVARAAEAVGRTEDFSGDQRMNAQAETVRVAVASEDRLGLDGRVSAHFGRCPAYTVAVVTGGKVVSHEVRENPHFEHHEPGAVPRFLVSLGADVVLAGGMGPRAVGMLEQEGISVSTGMSGTVAEAIQAWIGGARGIIPCQHDHPESCGGHGE